MKHSEAQIGLVFGCGDKRWRVTDVGARVVVAICIDPVEKVTVEDGRKTVEMLTFEEANKEGWFNGPPYSVAESVFDEYDLDGCEII